MPHCAESVLCAMGPSSPLMIAVFVSVNGAKRMGREQMAYVATQRQTLLAQVPACAAGSPSVCRVPCVSVAMAGRRPSLAGTQLCPSPVWYGLAAYGLGVT